MKKIPFFITLIFVVYACGPTLESSQKAWKNNLTAIEKLKIEYPVYSILIDKKFEEAKKKWDEVQGISDEEKKLDKMVEANSLLNSGTIGNLRNLKSKISGLKRKKEALLKLKIPNQVLEERTQSTVNDIKKAIKKAEKVVFASREDFTSEEAPSKIDRAWNILNSTYKEVEIAIDNIKKANSEIANAQKEKEQQTNEDKKKEELAKQPVKCEYCGTMNDPGSTKCKNCGAPIEPKK